jgi:hypothetical protein
MKEEVMGKRERYCTLFQWRREGECPKFTTFILTTAQ